MNLGFKNWLESAGDELYVILQKGPFYHYTRQPVFRPHPKHTSQSVMGPKGLYVSSNPQRWNGWAEQKGYRYVAIIDLKDITLEDIEQSQKEYDRIFGDREEVYIPPSLFHKIKVIQTKSI